MRITPTRVAQVEVHSQQDAFVATIQRLLSFLERYAERIAMCAVVSVFWGMILYVAVTYSLP